MPAIPGVMTLLNKIASTHEKKNEDYAASDNQFENFEHSALVSSWFKQDIDKAFVTLITTKLTRLATLLNSDKPPNNESIDDSFLDLATYSILWGAYRSKMDNSNVPALPLHIQINELPYNKWMTVTVHPHQYTCAACQGIIVEDTGVAIRTTMGTCIVHGNRDECLKYTKERFNK